MLILFCHFETRPLIPQKGPGTQEKVEPRNGEKCLGEEFQKAR